MAPAFVVEPPQASGLPLPLPSLWQGETWTLYDLIQVASCVGPGKSNLPFELRRKAGDCSRVTAGPIDLI